MGALNAKPLYDCYKLIMNFLFLLFCDKTLYICIKSRKKFHKMKKSLKLPSVTVALLSLLTNCSDDKIDVQPNSVKSTSDFVSYSYIPGSAVDISVGGENGIPYILGADLESNGGHKVYIGTNSTNPNWNYLPGPGAIKIAASETDSYFGGRYYIITPSGEIYRYAGGTWENFSATHGGMLATDIDVMGGGSSRSDRYEIDLYILGTDNISGGHPVYRFNFNNNSWTQIGNQGATSLTIDSYRRVWITNDQGYIFRNDVNNSSSGWIQTTGLAADISCLTGLRMYVLGKTTDGVNSVFSQEAYLDPTAYGWRYEGGYGKQIAAGPNDELWVVSYDNSIWRSQ